MAHVAAAPVAIVGVGCVFPGAQNFGAFTEFLLGGRCAIRALPADRFDRELYHSPARGVPGKSYCWLAGCVESFAPDLRALGLPPGALEALDPFHAIVLQAALEAFASARLAPPDVQGQPIPVLLGSARGSARGEDHLIARGAAEALLAIDDDAELRLSPDECARLRAEVLAAVVGRRGASLAPAEGAWPGSLSHAIAAVVSHAFRLTGRHAVVDSACASSLSALHAGVRLIRQGRADMALVGGASMLTPGILVMYAQAGTVSSEGSFPFDQRASGFIPGEGAGMLLLQRLDHAVRDGNRIYGVIRGIGSACDGRGKAVWAPRKEGQLMAIERAFADGGVDPADVGMIEAHATSTYVGDTTEVAALSEFFGRSGSLAIPVGSVKGNVGHLIEGASTPSMLKVLAAFESQVIPPSIGYASPNRDIDWSRTPLRHATQPVPWPKGSRPRVAAVDSFGIGGLDCHMVIEEPPSKERAAELIEMARRCPVPPREPIAIVGFGCVVPGARNADELRARAGSERPVAGPPPRDRVDPRVAPAGVQVAAVDFEFDWKRFQIPPVLVAQMDPLQLMAMEVASQVMADLGGPDRLDRDRVALFMGSAYYPDHVARALIAIRCPEFARELVAALERRGVPLDEARAAGARLVEEVRRRLPPLNADTVANSTQTGIVFRVGKLYDLHGPTHCVEGGGAGASLSAIEIGCETLWQREADLVLCGGGDRSLRPQRLEEVPGEVIAGEGLVMFGLKRLGDAEAAGDRIHAVIEAIESAGSGDWYGSLDGARAALQRTAGAAHERGSSGRVQHIEYASALDDMQGAAGPIAMARAAIALGNRGTPAPAHRVLATVEAPGGVGTSYHVILGAAPGCRATDSVVAAVAPPRPVEPLPAAREPVVVRAQSRDQLASTLAALTSETIDRLQPGDRIGRGACAIGLRSGPDLAARVRLGSDLMAGRLPPTAAALRGVALGEVSSAGGSCFLFPGLGSQYPGMLREVAAAYPSAAARLAAIDRVLSAHKLPSLGSILVDGDRLAGDARFTQVAVLAGDLAMYDVARAHGLVPALVSGHSFGDYAALVAAKAWSLEDAVRAALCRAELISQLAPPAAMVSLFASRERVAQLLDGLPGYAAASNINSPDQVVVSGETTAIAALEQHCRIEAIECRRLAVPTGFHSEILRSVCQPFARALADLRFERPAIRFLSSTNARELTDPDKIRQSLVDQLVTPVDFVAQIEHAYASGIRVFVETGANNILTRLAARILEGRPALVVSLDEKRKVEGAEMIKIEAALAAIRATEVVAEPEIAARVPPAAREVHAAADPGECGAIFSAAEWARLSAQPGWSAFWTAARPMIARWANDLYATGMLGRPVPDTARPAPSVKIFDATTRRRSPRIGSDSARAPGLQAREPARAPASPRSAPVPAPASGSRLTTPPPAATPSTNAPSASAPSASTPSTEIEREVTSFLFDLVVQRTGYPRELVQLDALLEADLGIDTVKQVELLGLVRQHLELARDPNVNVADLPTLRRVRDHVMDQLGGQLGGQLSGAGAGTVTSHAAPTATTAAMPPRRAGAAEPVEAAEPTEAAVIERELTHLLIDLVVQRTGYPRELVQLDALLEADLGIDTVKQVELLGTVRQHLELARDPNVNIADLPTLRKLRDYVVSAVAAPAAPAALAAPATPLAPPVPPAMAVPRPTERVSPAAVDLAALPGEAPHTAAVARRYVLRTRIEPSPERAAGSYRPARLLVVGGGRVAPCLAELMANRGTKVELVEPGAAEPLAAHVEELIARGPFPDLCLTGGLARAGRAASSGLSSLTQEAEAALRSVILPSYRVVQVWARRRGGVQAATVSAVTGMGGAFGELPILGWLPEGGAIAGLLKSVRRELGVRAKLLDIDPAEDPEIAASALLRELDDPAERVEVGWLRGARRVPELVPAPLGPELPAGPAPRLALVTGGGRGITAQIAVALARAGVSHLELLGRSPLRRDLPELRQRLSELGLPALRQEILRQLQQQGHAVSPREWNAACATIEAALEVDETLRRIHELGATARYHACDVTDRTALAVVLERVRESGPIEAVVHGAGLELSRAFMDKPLEELERTVAVKVLGALHLLSLTERDPVRWFAGFSSIAGRFGGVGQADYSLANEWLSRLCAVAAARAPDRRVVSLGWPPWDEIGMAVRGSMRERLTSLGVPFLGVEEGCRHFVREMIGPSGEGEIDVTLLPEIPAGSQYGDLDRLLPDRAAEAACTSLAAMTGKLPVVDLLRRANPREVAFECRVDARRDLFLDHHRLDGVALLPAVVMTELVASAARLLRPDQPIAGIADLAITGPVKLPHDGRAAVRVVARLHDGHAEVALSSDVYSRAGHLIQSDENRATARVAYGPLLAGHAAPAPVVGRRLPYRYPEEGSDRVWWGESMRCLEEMIIGADSRHGAVVKVRAAEALRPGRAGTWWCPAPLLDGAFVACWILTHHLQAAQTNILLPVRLGSLVVGRQPHAGELCHAVIDLKRRDGRDFTFDLAVFDGANQLVVAASDYLARAIDAHRPAAIEARP